MTDRFIADHSLDDDVTNNSSNTHFEDILQMRVTRRQTLFGGLAATTAALFGSVGLAACGSDNNDDVVAPAPGGSTPGTVGPLTLGFTAVAKSLADRVIVPAGYNVDVLIATGDPLVFGVSDFAGDGSESGESYELRVGDNHDGMNYFGMSDAGKWQADRSDRGVLCLNHEYINETYLHVNGPTVSAAGLRPTDEIVKEINSHGVAFVELSRNASNKVAMTKGSRYNRRITANTTIDIAGPVRGSAYVKTAFSPTGVQARGTINNCATGYTPWGTFLSGEENWSGYFYRAAGDDAKRTAAENTSLARAGRRPGTASRYGWEKNTDSRFRRWDMSVVGASADGTDDFRNELNTQGFVLEVDPFAPEQRAVKRTALGRMAHEGAWPAKSVAGKPVVFYMGDDAQNEYIYKYVSKAPWDAADIGKGLAAGAKYLDDGLLYVAKFNADGTGQWLELTYGKNGLDATNSVYPFANQADVSRNSRLAADARGATKMDRPEWGTVNPTTGDVYMTLTNNSSRVAATATPTGTQQRVDTANPRSYEDPKGTATQRGNVNGHIIRWREDGNDPAGLSFKWDIYLFGAQADAAADVNLSGLTADNDFSSPDGIWSDPRGMLWIQTDDGAYTDVTNCMMLAAIPGTVGDGTRANAAGGASTIKGKNADASNLRRFLVGPKDCEVTGVEMTPDYRTMFVNIQHPGESGTLAAPISHWPDSQTVAASTKRPRSATIVITRTDGKQIGI